MPKRLTTDEFIEKAKAVHGDKYDYSKVVYVNTKSKVSIICPKHGLFLQSPNDHLENRGCKKCGYHSKKIHGVGINDCDEKSDSVFYKIWTSMLSRCYSSFALARDSSYIGCTVCDEWLLLSNFKKWCENNYVYNYDLDKDLLSKNSKKYSPDTCCFLPHEINVLLLKNKKEYKCRKRMQISCSGKYIGIYHTPEEAFKAYKEAKEKHIKEVAEKYYKEGKINKRVYIAMLNYEI